MQFSSNLYSNVTTSTRINSSMYICTSFVCFTLRVILQGFVDPKCNSGHSKIRHKCTYQSCTRDFKNIGDLTRHLKQHNSEKHQCPDCNYSNADARNFESHRLKHSRITKYSCDVCNQEFIYNTQYQRHIAEKKCKVKQSASPEY